MWAKRAGTIMLFLGFVGLGLLSWFSFEVERQRGVDLHHTNEKLKLQIRARRLLDQLDATLLAVRRGAPAPPHTFIQIKVSPGGDMLFPRLEDMRTGETFLARLPEGERPPVRTMLEALYAGKNSRALEATRPAQAVGAEAEAFLLYHRANLLKKVGQADAAKTLRLKLLELKGLSRLPHALIADTLLEAAGKMAGPTTAATLCSLAEKLLLPILHTPRSPAHFWLRQLCDLVSVQNARAARALTLRIEEHLAGLRMRDELMREDLTHPPVSPDALSESSHELRFVWWQESPGVLVALMPLMPQALEAGLGPDESRRYGILPLTGIPDEDGVVLGPRAPGLRLVLTHPTTPRVIPWRSLIVFSFVILGLLILVQGFLREKKSLAARRALLETRSSFLANVSHQLKTPVANLRLFAETLETGQVQDSEEKQRMLGILRTEAERLGQYLHHIMSEERLDAGELPGRTIDLSHLLERRLDDWSRMAAMGGLRFHVEMPPALPPVLGDETALTDSLDNVVDNALAFSPTQGLVSLRVRLEGDSIVIEIRDEGPGIPREDHERIFDRFFRGEHALARQGTGTGLGLHIARLGIERAGGTIEVAESSNRGTTMRLRIPSVGEEA